MITVDEWRALERASPDVKHEYIDGYVYAMAGGTRVHSRLCIRAASIIDAALGDGPCTAYTSDMATQVSTSRYTYPDLVVTCAEGDQPSGDETEVFEPRVVIEVLSQSTERYDRSRKFAYYRECPTLHEYVLVNAEYQAVEVYRRAADSWGVFHVYGADDTAELTSIGVSFPVGALYRRTGVPAALPEPPAAAT